MNETIKSPWPRAIIATFVLLAIGNVIILILALNSRTATMDEHPYESGQAYQGVIAEKDAARRDGISFQIHQESGVELLLNGIDSALEWQVEVNFLRPSDSELDRKIIVKGAGPEFHLSSEPLKAGLWFVQIVISDGVKRYFLERKMVI